MSLASLLNATAAVYAPTRSTDGIGSTKEVWAVSIASLSCRISAVSLRERELSGATGTEVTHRMYCLPNATAIAEGDEVRVSSTVYKVTAVNDVDRMAHHWEIDLKEHRPDRHGR